MKKTRYAVYSGYSGSLIGVFNTEDFAAEMAESYAGYYTEYTK